MEAAATKKDVPGLAMIVGNHDPCNNHPIQIWGFVNTAK